MRRSAGRLSTESNAMKTIFRTVVLLVMSLVSYASAAEPISIAKLVAGDVLQVVHASTGCFHNERHDFSFRRVDGVLKAEVVRLHHARMEGDEKAREQRTPVAIVHVTAAEAERLERLLAYYRGGPDNGCTTQDKISLTLTRKDGTVAKETYLDGSCASWERKDLMFFPELVKKAEETR